MKACIANANTTVIAAVGKFEVAESLKALKRNVIIVKISPASWNDAKGWSMGLRWIVLSLLLLITYRYC